MKKRSKQNNPEQTTRHNDLELGKEFDPVKQSKKAYEQTGGQPQKSKQHIES
ncbi:hypothetical protein GFC29_2108 [Anoxybacillus sp. B7M1]|jgi:hypothetical protein|nr:MULTISPECIES: hypothetical protein [unclassified Anoxybacillus]ANB59097.1 hypothetical protein GFC28_3326 [Anoxybacillus sp. B2M1]ANB63843.1 hypothetical protein GFC29_2108 [Anoxybacillus sp. B7M1]